MPKTSLILDFGGVITKTIFEHHRETEQRLGLPTGSLTWLGPLDPETDALWRRVLLGEMSEREYWLARASEIGRLVGETWTDVATFLRRTWGRDPNGMVRPEATQTIRRVKAAGVRVAVLSNDLDGFYGQEMRSKFDLLAELDVVMDGTSTKVFKPDPHAFELCLGALGADATGALYVDDQVNNVCGARKVGMEAIHFDIRDPAGSYARVEGLVL